MKLTFAERLRRWTLRSLALRTGRPIYDITIFLEGIYPEFLGESACTVLIPNQEWFRDNHHAYLPRMDWILCKTQDAVRIFDDLGQRTRFIGFTSSDCRDTAANSKDNTFFHLAGMSQQKGTKTLLELWQRHPEWPNLLVVQAAKTHDGNDNRRYEASNVEHVLDRVSVERLKVFQNERRFHLCLSEAEGFGHYIVEALSCSAVVFTTNAPPMNEVVQSNRGILVAYTRTESQYLATNYIVDPADLERRITEVLRLPTVEHERIGANARAWYDENDSQFQSRLTTTVRELIETSQRDKARHTS
jgi:glycosyltransferase involved in cell wall biosynthesis